MSKIEYKEQRFSAESKGLIIVCDEILSEYAADGYLMTLRQLYYQLVTREIVENNQKQYKRVGKIVNDARMAGLLDWSHIVDRTRSVRRLTCWTSPEEIVQATAESFHLDRWAGQIFRPEIWIEKDALVGVFEGVCNKFDVPLFSCRGYTSQSEIWAAARRLQSHAGQVPIIFHFGDHDPSGTDMSRDIAERLRGFGAEIEFKRVALNMDQIEAYNPPPNPAKVTDSRIRGYKEKFGDNSWELDALEPMALIQLVKDEIENIRDPDAWDGVLHQEFYGKHLLWQIGKRFEEVAALLLGKPPR